MSVMSKLTREQKALAINLAMFIECGVVHAKHVTDIFKQDTAFAEKIMDFWANFDNTTRRALDIVSVQVAREHFELCLNLSSEGHPEIEN